MIYIIMTANVETVAWSDSLTHDNYSYIVLVYKKLIGLTYFDKNNSVNITLFLSFIQFTRKY